MASNTATIATSALSALTVLIAWMYRYKIAELAKANRRKAPNEVLFDGYERLLKSYQEGIRERDLKIEKLEQILDNAQNELDKSRQIILEMKDQERKKDEIIHELESKLAELKALHQDQQLNASS